MRFENRSTIIDAFLASDADALVAALPDDVTFHSPMQDYAGKRRAGRVLTALTTVLEAPTRLETPADGVLRFTGQLDGRDAEGVLIVGDADVTLFIRPLAALLAGIDRMKAQLS